MEDIIDTFGEGLKNLFKNPILFAPMGLLLLIAFISAFILGFALENVLTAVPSSESFLYISIIYLAYIAVLLILSSYLMAGLVGMSKEAVAFGKTNFSDMFKYGNKFALRLILASIILLILYLIAAIFWAPTVYVFMNAGYTIEGIFDVMINNPDAFLSIIKTLAAPALIGLLLTIIYTIVLTLFFYFVTYAIVVDDISVISAYKKSYAVLKQNFWKVLAFIILVWLLTIVFTTILQVVMLPLSIIAAALMFTNYWLGLILYIALIVIAMVFSLVFAVAVTVWTTRFYISVTGQTLYRKEV